MVRENYIPYAKLKDGDFYIAERVDEYYIDLKGNEVILFTNYYSLGGTLKFIKKYGKIRCRKYENLETLVANDKEIFKNNKKIVEWLM